MRAVIGRSVIRGSVDIPSSKSMTIRALVCAALSAGESTIVHPLISEDTIAAASVLTQLGTVIREGDDSWMVTGGKFRAGSGDLNCRESATTMRFMTAVCSLIPGQHRLIGGPSLSRRPIGSLIDSLKKLGVRVTTENLSLPPVLVEGGTFKGGLTDIPGNVSSQFISALLLISPFAQKGVGIKLTTPITSKPYVLMTLSCLKQFGINVQRKASSFVVMRQRYTPATVEIESDWSSASYFLALAAISDEGMSFRNLNMGSVQGDRIMVDILRNMGAKVKITGNEITISRGELKGLYVDLSDAIDLLPTVAVMAALAKGTSEISGIQRARIKESNRISSIREGLVKLDINVVEDVNRLTITGIDAFKELEDEDVEETLEEAPSAEEFFAGASQEPTSLRSHNDHRIAMAFAVLGAALGNIAISNTECVSKTYPTFWQEFQKAGGEVTLNE